jgi:acetate kinase
LKVLVFNCGSSSLTFKVFEKDINNNVKIIFSGKAHKLLPTFDELPYIEYTYDGFNLNEKFAVKSHAYAAELVLNKLKEIAIEPDYIGHRWLHSAGQFNTVFIDDPLRIVLHSLIPLFPIHHPAILSVINKCRYLEPEIPQYVTVDNAFHSTIPYEAFTYALPKELINTFGFRKFGFHGLSYQNVTKSIGKYFKSSRERLNIIACHLGTGGSSVAAIKDGKSIDTSMGYTSLTGLVMSTRTGDIDPMLSVYLMGVFGYRPDDLMNLFNKKSGLLGVSEFSSDIRDIIKRISEDSHSRLAFNMYIHRLKKYIGSYAVVLGGIDILIFTDDIGVHNWLVREKVCENMDWCGIKIDSQKNHEANTDKISQINSKDSKVKVLSVPTEEENEIFYEGLKLIEGSPI